MSGFMTVVQSPAEICLPSRPEDMNLPGFRFHALVGRDKGGYAVNASGNRRITFGWMEGDVIDVDLEHH
jgi:proteic killer suppression protein